MVYLFEVKVTENIVKGYRYGRIHLSDRDLALLIGKTVYVLVIPKDHEKLLKKILDIVREFVQESSQDTSR